MDVLDLDDVVAGGDDDGEALVESLAAPPTGVSTPASVVSHEAMLVDHENWTPVHLTEGRFERCKCWYVAEMLSEDFNLRVQYKKLNIDCSR